MPSSPPSSSASPAAGHPLRGLLLLLASLFFFACLDATTKYLARDYNVPLIAAIRYLVNWALLVVLLAPRHGRQLVETKRGGLVAVRAACLVAVSLFVGFALQRMPVAETTAILFLGPMLVVLMARPLLGERIGPLGWLATVGGLVGVLLIVRPGAGLDTLGVVFGLCAVVGHGTYQLLSRLLARTERTVALLFHTTLAGCVCFGLALPWFWYGDPPTLTQTLLFISLGFSGGIGHYLYTAAFRLAPASLLAPANYVQLVWAGLLGWLVFDHVPDALSIAGMCVIAASGVLIALKAR